MPDSKGKPTYHDTADFFLAMAKRAKYPARKQQLLDAAAKYRKIANEQDGKRQPEPGAHRAAPS